MTFKSKIQYLINLSVQLATSDFKLKNERSYLGIFWYLLNPILTFSLLLLIFSEKFSSNIFQYPAYLFIGVILLNFFQTCTQESTRSIVSENHYLIKSINFPRESLIISIVLKNIFSHIFEILILICLMFFLKISLFNIFYYLMFLIPFTVFVLGICLLLSSLTVFFIDLDNIWNFSMKILWFITPVFYAIDNFTKVYYLNLLNPLYYFMSLARDLIIGGKISSPSLLITTLLISFVSIISGFFLFKRLSKVTAELI